MSSALGRPCFGGAVILAVGFVAACSDDTVSPKSDRGSSTDRAVNLDQTTRDAPKPDARPVGDVSLPKPDGAKPVVDASLPKTDGAKPAVDASLPKTDAGGTSGDWAIPFGCPDENGPTVRWDTNKGLLEVFSTYTCAWTLGTTALPAAAKGSSNSVLGALSPQGSFSDVTSVAGHATSVRDASGNVYLAGTYTAPLTLGTITLPALSPGSKGAVFVVKLSPTGQSLWAVTFGDGTSSLSVHPALSANGLFLVGHFKGTMTVNSDTVLSGLKPYNLYIVRLDPQGKILWGKTGGGPGAIMVEGVDADASDNVYVGGMFFEPATFGAISISGHTSPSIWDSGDVFVAKVDASGQFVWVKPAGSLAMNQDQIWGLAVNPAGDVCVTGLIAGPGDFGAVKTSYLGAPGSNDIFVAGLSSSGTFSWATTAGGSSPDGSIGTAVAIAPNGTCYVTGVFTGTAQFDATQLVSEDWGDVFVAEVSPAGKFTWAVRAGGLGDDWSLGLAFDGAATLYVAGQFGSPKATFGSNSLSTTADQQGFIWKLRIPSP